MEITNAIRPPHRTGELNSLFYHYFYTFAQLSGWLALWRRTPQDAR